MATIETNTVTTSTSTYTLTLTEDEAKELADVLALVGGDMHGPRGKIQAIQSALTSAGVHWSNDVKDRFEAHAVYGGPSLYYKDGA